MRDLILFTILALFSFNSFANEGDEVTPLMLRGSVDGYQTRNFDDKLNFGLVLPTLKKEQLMNFNLSSVLSTETDIIRAAGQRIPVPSNVSLPNQRERYFITIRINKPGFTLPIHFDELPEQVAVVEGSMPFGDTVDALRSGAPLFSVINSFTFNSYSLSPITGLEGDIEMTAGDNGIEGERLLFGLPFEVDSDYVSIGLNLDSTLSDEGENLYFPINMKTLERDQELTQTSENNVPMVVTVPKEIFNSDLEETANLPFPFSLVWGESKPEMMLPLAKDFITFGEMEEENLKFIEVDSAQLEGFNVLEYKITVFDGNGNVTFEMSGDTAMSRFEFDVQNASRVRFDILAADPDPVLESINSEYMLSDDVFSQAKYITRYEEDLN